MMEYGNSYPDLIRLMGETEQTIGVNVHTHGMMVVTSYLKMRDELENNIGDPVIVELYKKIGHLILGDEIVLRYQEYHDCGKPFCKIVDEYGKVHFPNHANVSADVWKHKYPEETVIQDLMRMDMEFHLTRSSDVDILWTHWLAPTLFFTAFAEIKANCQMFGGEDSTSFKIKKKRLIQSAKRGLSLFA